MYTTNLEYNYYIEIKDKIINKELLSKVSREL